MLSDADSDAAADADSAADADAEADSEADADAATEAEPQTYDERVLGVGGGTPLASALGVASAFFVKPNQLPNHSICQKLCPTCTAPGCPCPDSVSVSFSSTRSM